MDQQALIERLERARGEIDGALAALGVKPKGASARAAAALPFGRGGCPNCGAKRERRQAANGFGATTYVCGECGADWN